MANTRNTPTYTPSVPPGYFAAGDDSGQTVFIKYNEDGSRSEWRPGDPMPASDATKNDPFLSALPQGYTGTQYAGKAFGQEKNDWYGMDPSGKLQRLMQVGIPTGEMGDSENPGTQFYNKYFLENDPAFQQVLSKFGANQATNYATMDEDHTFFDDVVLPHAVAALTGAAGAGLLSGAGVAAGAGASGAGGAEVGSTSLASSPEISAIASGGDPFVNVGLGATGTTGGIGAAGASSLGGGSSLMDFLGSLGGSGASTGGGGGLTGNLLTTGGNFLINQFLANRAQHQASDLQGQQNPLNDPRRQPFQQQVTDMVNHPEQYFQNNPFAKSLADFYRNSVIPSQFARSGNAGEVIDRNGSQFATAVGQNYNGLLGQLGALGGFNSTPQVNGVPQLLQNSNTFNSEAFRGLGDLTERIFGNAGKPNSAGTGVFPQNPVTSSSTVFS